MTTFDVSSFMNQQVNSVNDTVIVPCPAGEFQATIRDVAIKTWQAKDDLSKNGLKFESYMEITDPEVVKATGRTPTKVRYDFILDLTPEGGLDMGKAKNVRLGRLREACDLNKAGAPFMFPMLEGRMLKVKVGHRPDPQDSNIIYDQIAGVTKA